MNFLFLKYSVYPLDKLKKINPKINCQFLHLEGTEKDYTVAQMKRLKKMFPKSKILID